MRQQHLLDNLAQITMRRKLSGMRSYFLAGQDCTYTINSLIVRDIVQSSPDQKRLHQTRLMPHAV